MIRFVRSRLLSFRHAFAGWWYVISTQKNAWVHSVVTLSVIALAAWLHLPLRDWAMLVVVIGLVWFAEFLNTALEAVVDLASPQKHPLAKVGKDVGAAAVLLSALVSIIIGLIVLGPPLLARMNW